MRLISAWWRFQVKRLTGKMPVTKKDLRDLPISFAGKDAVWVFIGPCSVTTWLEFRIPLDGRLYNCGGTIIFKNGESHRASFLVDTTSFDFLKIESVYLNIGEDWYGIMEPELLTKLNLEKEAVFPFTWLPDRPLDYSNQGPYKMKSL